MMSERTATAINVIREMFTVGTTLSLIEWKDIVDIHTDISIHTFEKYALTKVGIYRELSTKEIVSLLNDLAEGFDYYNCNCKYTEKNGKIYEIKIAYKLKA